MFHCGDIHSNGCFKDETAFSYSSREKFIFLCWFEGGSFKFCIIEKISF